MAARLEQEKALAKAPGVPPRSDAFVCGGGLAGCLLAWELQRAGLRPLLLDDPSLSNCSRIAAGLVNPVAGKRLKKVWKADTLVPFAHAYYEQLERTLGLPLFHPRPAYRFLQSDAERDLWRKRRADPAYAPWTRPGAPAELARRLGRDPRDAFAVLRAGYLDTAAAVEALRARLADAGRVVETRFRPEEFVFGPEGVAWRSRSAACAVFCEGSLVRDNPWFAFAPFKPACGVIGDIRLDQPLGEAIVLMGKFLIPLDAATVRVGATYRWDARKETPDRESVAELEAFLAGTLGAGWQWIERRAGVRPATAGALPIVGRHPVEARAAVFNGFGSKGVLQIPYFARRLARHLALAEPLPPETLPERFKTAPAADQARRPWKATEIAKAHIASRLRDGDTAIDATLGNGHDALWLCQAVGPAGQVFGFDIQPRALEAAAARLRAAGLLERAALLQRGHEALAATLGSSQRGRVAAVVFNLGYRPGGDPSVVTDAQTTLRALDQALDLLKPGGALSVVAYPAHPGGGEEAAAVERWSARLDPERFERQTFAHPKGLPQAPRVHLVARRRPQTPDSPQSGDAK